tara:strand:+ start:155 stop:517 length:363 start_codon:yes stop_codon:yes gene_type:complete
VENDTIIQKLQKLQSKFSKERNWDKYHTPRNLSMALSVEVSELLEIFQWMTDNEILEKLNDKDFKDSISDEIADIFLYLIRISEKLDINIEKSVLNKLEKNKIKYPIELSKDNAIKYNKR